MNVSKISKHMVRNGEAAADVHLEAPQPFAPAAVASAARDLADQAVVDAGMRLWESGSGKASLLSDEVAKLIDFARTSRKVNSRSPVPKLPAQPWYRRFDRQ